MYACTFTAIQAIIYNSGYFGIILLISIEAIAMTTILANTN